MQRAAAAHQTTPEAPDLQRDLRAMVQHGDEAAVVESTSHGLQLDRVGAIGFAAAVYTTFSPDHLDFHGSMERYFEAKARLFDPILSSAAIINIADPNTTHFTRFIRLCSRVDPCFRLTFS